MLDQRPDRDSREEMVGARLEAVLRRYYGFENDLSIAPNERREASCVVFSIGAGRRGEEDRAVK